MLFLSISSMWAYVPVNFSFAGHLAKQYALDQKLTKDCMLIQWISVHRIIDQTRALNRDLSDAFNDSLGDMWMHQDATIKIVQENNREIVGSWPTTIVQSWSSICLLLIKRPTIFALKSLRNIDVLLCKLNS